MRPFNFGYPMEFSPRKGECEIDGVKYEFSQLAHPDDIRPPFPVYIPHRGEEVVCWDYYEQFKHVELDGWEIYVFDPEKEEEIPDWVEDYFVCVQACTNPTPLNKGKIRKLAEKIREMGYLAQDIAKLYREHGVSVVVDDNGNVIRYERGEKHYLNDYLWKKFWLWVAKYMEAE